MTESAIREKIARIGKSLFDRGLTSGSTGNISVRIDDGWLVTPTGTSLGDLDPADISRIGADGTHQSGAKPSKEAPLHLAMYGQRPATGAVVHLHSTHSAAVSCIADLDADNMLPPLTAYYVMRIGKLPMVPFYPPGDEQLADAVRDLASRHHAIMLANHGPVVGGASLEEATGAIEELEESAKLFLLLRSERTRPLTAEQVEALRSRVPIRA